MDAWMESGFRSSPDLLCHQLTRHKNHSLAKFVFINCVCVRSGVRIFQTLFCAYATVRNETQVPFRLSLWSPALWHCNNSCNWQLALHWGCNNHAAQLKQHFILHFYKLMLHWKICNVTKHAQYLCSSIGDSKSPLSCFHFHFLVLQSETMAITISKSTEAGLHYQCYQLICFHWD